MQSITHTPHRGALVVTAAATLIASALIAGPAHASVSTADDSTFISAADLDALAPNGSAALDPDVFLEGIEQLEASRVP